MRNALMASSVISAMGLPAAQYGASSLRKSINFGPHLSTSHHSLGNPSPALTAFNADPVTRSLTCLNLDDPALCDAHHTAQSFIAALHPPKHFKLVDSYISSHSGVLHQHFLQLHHDLPVANANLNVNIDTLSGQIISYSEIEPRPLIDTLADYALDQLNQHVFTDNQPQPTPSTDSLGEYATPPLVADSQFHHKPNDPRHGLLSFLARQAPSSNLALLLPSLPARQELVTAMQLDQESATALRISNAPTTHAPVPATLVYILDQHHKLKLAWKYEVLTYDNQYEAYVQADAAVDGEEEVYMTVDWVRDFRPTGGETGAQGLVGAIRETRTRSSNFNINTIAPVEDVFATASPVNVTAKPSYKVFPWGT